jgi:hypothetical protein
MADVRQALQHLTPARADVTASIAVLPFADLSRDADDEYFSDGLSEEIINALAQVRDLKVIARTSAQDDIAAAIAGALKLQLAPRPSAECQACRRTKRICATGRTSGNSLPRHPGEAVSAWSRSAGPPRMKRCRGRDPALSRG